MLDDYGFDVAYYTYNKDLRDGDGYGCSLDLGPTGEGDGFNDAGTGWGNSDAAFFVNSGTGGSKTAEELVYHA
jgi:hypothetical protein